MTLCNISSKEMCQRTRAVVAVILVAYCLLLVEGHDDEVLHLPGLSHDINFKHYSGYLNASNGKHLHYWFAESQKNPANDPVVLWLNGGPGCSSLDGMLYGVGPFLLDDNAKTLHENPNSWNKVANVLFLESPAGVGFSYSEDGKYVTDDDIVAEDNHLALQHFFEKFPQFQKNEFFITGESYAGVYIPTLSLRVLNGRSNINFKGFAIGNGALNKRFQGDSVIFFAYYHGLFGLDELDKLTINCCENNVFSPTTCNFGNTTSKDCQRELYQLYFDILLSGVNVYNIYDKCPGGADIRLPQAGNDEKLESEVMDFTDLIVKLQYKLPCTESTSITSYLNRPDVRSALHVPTRVDKWTACSTKVVAGYKKKYDTMKPHILQLVESGKVRGLIYSGDVDMVCNFIGTQWFVEDLRLKIKLPYERWLHDNQVAGFVKEFERLAFVTVKGSGHKVPHDKGGPAFKMISRFLSGTSY